MLSTLRQRVSSVLPPNSRARRRQERSSLREGTTPPLRRSLRTFRVLRLTDINSPGPLLQSCLRHRRCAPLHPLLASMRHLWYARPESAAPKTVSAMRRASLAFNVGGMRSSCRLTQHPLLGRSRPGLLFLRRLRQKSPVPPLRGKPTAWLYLAAIPPHLRRGKPRRKCSERPGGSRSGCWRRQCRDSASLHPPQTAPERQCLASPRT